MNRYLAIGVILSLILFACGDDSTTTDSGLPRDGSSDSSPSGDSSPGDSSPGDSSPGDSGPGDAGDGGTEPLPDPVVESLGATNCCTARVDIGILGGSAPILAGMTATSPLEAAAFDRSSGTFVEAVISTMTPHMVTLVVGGDDGVHVLFMNGADLHYAVRTGSTWTVTAVGGGNVFGTGHHFDIALDGTNTAHIAFENGDTRTLMYGHWNGASFDVEAVDAPTGGTDQFGDFANLVVAGDGTVHIASSATVTDVRGLRYSVGTAGAFTSTNVSGVGEGVFGTILLDASGNPHIVSARDAGARARGVYWSVKDGSAWTETVIDSDNNVAEMDAALDALGRLHVAIARDISGLGSWGYFRTDGTTTEMNLDSSVLDHPKSVGIAIDASNVAHLAIPRAYVHF